MSEKRFRTNDLVKFNYSEIGEYIDENHTDRPLRNDEVCDLLNELAEENEKLRKELSTCEKFRYQIFKEMEKIIEEKKNDDGRFQVWEVPPITMGMGISFTTNNDGCD